MTERYICPVTGWEFVSSSDVTYLTFCRSYVSHSNEIEYEENIIFENYLIEGICPEQDFQFENKNYRRGLYKVKQNNATTYDVLYMHFKDSNAHWFDFRGAVRFGKWTSKEDWQNLILDFQSKKDIKELIKYRKIL